MGNEKNENELEQAICQKINAESQKLLTEWDRLSESEEQSTAIAENIYKSNSPNGTFAKAIEIRVYYYLLPLVRKLIQIESELRVSHRAPYSNKRLQATKDFILNVIEEKWRMIVNSAYYDAERNAIHSKGSLYSYKEKELKELRDYAIKSRFEKDFVLKELDMLLEKASADVKLHLIQAQSESARLSTKESQLTQNIFNFSNVSGSNININSLLNDVTQTIDSASNMDDIHKKQLEELIKQLNIELQKVALEKKDDADALAKLAKDLIEASTKTQPNKSIIQITAEGLKKAAENIANVMPTVATIASSITKIVFQITGIPLT